jgi:glutamate dehydrogenase
MTSDVGALVLRDNYLQSQALSMMELSAKNRLPEHAHFIRSLEITNELDRVVEYLPSVEEIADRSKEGAGLSRPELAVLLSYSKIALFNRLIRTDVPEDPYLSQELERYFPVILQERYRTLMRKHRLRREIITTAITNSLVNRMGASFALRAQEDTGADAAIVARAYTIARECIEARELWVQIEALDNKVPAATQYALMNDIARLLRFITYWLIDRHHDALRIETRVAALKPGIRELRKDFKTILTGDTLIDFGARQQSLIAEHIPSKLAGQLAGVEALYSAPDIVEVAIEAKRSVTQVAQVYFSLDTLLSINWLRDQVQAIDVKDRWQSVARNTLRDTLYALHRTLCHQALACGKEDAVAIWQTRQATNVQHAVDSLKEMRALPKTDFATLSVAVQGIRKLT